MIRPAVRNGSVETHVFFRPTCDHLSLLPIFDCVIDVDC